MSELYDIVDHNDNVISQSTFDEAYANGKIMRVVHNWFVNDQGQVLLQFRGHHETLQQQYLDASVGGHVHAGETYDEAVARNTKNELGIEAAPLLLHKIFNDAAQKSQFVSVYVTAFDKDATDWEPKDGVAEWVGLVEVKAMVARFPHLFCCAQSLDVLIQHLEAHA